MWHSKLFQFWKADWHAIDSPKKRTDKLVLFAFLLFTANKSNSSFPFWENLWLVNLLFSFNWPLINTLYQWFGYMSWGYQEKLFFDVPAYEGWVRRWMYIPYGHLVLYHRQDHMKKKKKRKNDLWSRVPYTDLFFSPVMDQKSIFFFTPALFPIHNRLHLTMNEPHDSVFCRLYRFGWFFNMYLTKLISLGAHFHQRKLWEIANANKYFLAFPSCF